MIILDQCHSASEKLWAYPFPNPTLTVACHQLTVVVQGRGRWTVPQIQTLNDNFSQIQNLTIAPLSWHYKEDTLGEKKLLYHAARPHQKKKKLISLSLRRQSPWDAVQEPFLIQLLWFVRSVQMVHFRLTKMHECVRRVKGVWVGTTWWSKHVPLPRTRSVSACLVTTLTDFWFVSSASHVNEDMDLWKIAQQRRTQFVNGVRG